MNVILAFLFAVTFAQDAEPFFKSGEAKFKQKDWDGAISDFTKAVELDPGMGKAYRKRADCRAMKQDFDGALDDASRAIEIDPACADACYERAKYWECKGKVDKAISDYSRAVELRPDFAVAYTDRGLLKMWNFDDMASAIEDFTKALEGDPGNAAAILEWRSEAHHRHGDRAGALKDIGEVIEKHPAHARAFCIRGLVLYDQGKWKDAHADFVKAGELDKAHAKSKIFAWLSRTRLGEAREASEEAEAFLKSFKPRTGADELDAKALSYLMGDLSEEKFTSIVREGDDWSSRVGRCEIHFLIGSKSLISGDKQAAARHFKKAVETGARSVDEYRLAEAGLKSIEKDD